MIHATVFHNFNDSHLVNILQVAGGQHVLPYVPECKVNKPFLQLYILRKVPKPNVFHFVCSYKVSLSLSDDELWKRFLSFIQVNAVFTKIMLCLTSINASAGTLYLVIMLSCKMFMSCNRSTESFLNITMRVHKYAKIKFHEKCVMYTYHQNFQFLWWG
jgi:hypothetical protein